MPSHTHWPDGRGAVCHFPTKKECDASWTEYLHGHLGAPCVKQFQESKTKRGRMNKVATCTIVNLPEHGQSFAQSLKSQEA